MKLLPIAFLLVSLLFLFSSCADVKEEIWLNRKGGGVYENEYDMSNMLHMLELIQNMNDENLEEDYLSQLKEIPTRVDTSINIGSVAPDSIQRDLSNPDILDKTHLNLMLDMSAKEMKIGIRTEFQSIQDLASLKEAMDGIKEYLQNNGNDNLNWASEIINGRDFSTSYILDRRTFRRKPIELGDDDVPLDTQAGEEQEKWLQMMQMMMGQGKYTTIIHFPGKVKAVRYNGDYEIVDKKTVRIESSLSDFIQKKKLPGFEVDFKCFLCFLPKSDS